MACLSTCHSAASRKGGSSLRAWGVSRRVCGPSPVNGLNLASLYYVCSLKEQTFNCRVLIRFCCLSDNSQTPQELGIIHLAIYLPPPFLSEVDKTWDCVVVTLNHFGIELHKTISRNYFKLRERRVRRGQTVATSTSHYSFLALWTRRQTAGSGRWDVHCVYWSIVFFPWSRNKCSPFKLCILEEMIVFIYCGVNIFTLIRDLL